VLQTARVVIAVPLFAGGLFFLAVGTIGLLRLPDIFTRMHATGKCDTLGAGLTLLALAVVAPSWAVALKYATLMAVILVINPTTAHVIANAAYRYGGLNVRGTKTLDLREGAAAGAEQGFHVETPSGRAEEAKAP
jgi:multicomponent Na+:H+ antiporter subunit G